VLRKTKSFIQAGGPLVLEEFLKGGSGECKEAVVRDCCFKGDKNWRFKSRGELREPICCDSA